MDKCDLMPRAPTITITTCAKPERSRTRCTAGRTVRLSAVLPWITKTATGQPRTAVSSP
jgi:hypothetical protein